MKTKTILIALGIAHLLVGASTVLLPDIQKTYLTANIVLGFCIMVAIYVWCRADAVTHHPLALGHAPLWAALLPPIFLPAYLFRTREKRRAFRSIGKAILIYIALSAIQLIAYVAASSASGA